MRKNFVQIFIIVFVVTLLFGGGIAYAQDYTLLAPIEGVEGIGTSVSVGGDGFNTYLNGLLRLGVGLATVLAVLMMVVGGMKYITTASTPGKEGAKENLTRALYGLILAIGSVALLATINTNLLNLEGIKVIEVGGDSLGTNIGADAKSLEDITPQDIIDSGKFEGEGWYSVKIGASGDIIVKNKPSIVFGIGSGSPYDTYSDCAKIRGTTSCVFINDNAEIVFDQQREFGSFAGAGWYFKNVDGSWTSLRYDFDDKERCEKIRKKEANRNSPRGPIIEECFFLDNKGNVVSADQMSVFDSMASSNEDIKNRLLNDFINVVNKNVCKFWGDTSCTMVGGLPESSITSLIDLRKASNTSLDITGGTETWLHSNGTRHGEGNPVVDLRTLVVTGQQRESLLTKLDLWILEKSGRKQEFGSPQIGASFQPTNNTVFCVELKGNNVMFRYEWEEVDHWHVEFDGGSSC